MPPLAPLRVCAFRARPRGAIIPMRCSNIIVRSLSEKNNPDKLPRAPQGQPGPNSQQQEHVSEEAAKMAKIQGGQGPDLEQGTPVQEIVQEEREQHEQAPQVLKEEAKTSNPSPDTKPSNSPTGTRAFSTLARRRLPELQSTISPPPEMDPALLSSLSSTTTSTTYTNNNNPRSKLLTTAGEQTGHKFPLPDITTIPTKPSTDKNSRNRANRKDALPIIPQLTNLLMRDGKKSVAERNMALILSTLRTLPAPTYSTTRPLLPGAPHAAYLPLNPIAYLTLAVDSVAPLMRIRSQRGAAGGGVALQIPVPLALRQRRRTAFTWILDATSKRANRGSGREMFAQRVAQEIVAVVEGRSGIWEKRSAAHRLATAARTNVGWKVGGMRR